MCVYKSALIELFNSHMISASEKDVNDKFDTFEFECVKCFTNITLHIYQL